MLGLTAVLLVVVLMSNSSVGMKVTWPQLMTYAREGKVAGTVEITDTQAVAKLKPGSVPGLGDDKAPQQVYVPLEVRAMDTYIAELRSKNYDFVSNTGNTFFGQLFLTIIGPVLLIGAMIFFLSRSKIGRAHV